MNIKPVRKGETEIGVFGHWRLSAFSWAGPTPKGWQRFKLYDARRRLRSKEEFWLWYDGCRFAQGNRRPVLQGRYPEMCRWAEQLVVDHVAAIAMAAEGELS